MKQVWNGFDETHGSFMGGLHCWANVEWSMKSQALWQGPAGNDTRIIGFANVCGDQWLF